MATYFYPVRNPIDALQVTETEFSPDLTGRDQALYVQLDRVRGTKYRTEVFPQLGILPGQEAVRRDNSVKIIISGHSGCGKTTELKRLAKELNSPARYFAISFNISDETVYGAFQADDLFIWIITKIGEALDENKISAGRNKLHQLLTNIVSETSTESEMKTLYQLEASLENGIEWNWFIKFKAAIKGVFSSTNETSIKIRQQIKNNPMNIINGLNEALIDIREEIHQKNLGKGIIFILDGPEKLASDVYRKLYVTDAHLLQTLNLNLISTVPIDAYYDIDNAPSKFTHRYTLPMVRLATPGAHQCFRELVTRRIQEEAFFEPGLLDTAIPYSGGCVRQLFHIVNKLILTAIGYQTERGVLKATQADLNEVVHDLGQEKYELLDETHLAILRRGEFLTGNEDVRKMLLQLILLKYNGNPVVNPLLNEYLHPANG